MMVTAGETAKLTCKNLTRFKQNKAKNYVYQLTIIISQASLHNNRQYTIWNKISSQKNRETAYKGNLDALNFH